MYVAVFAPSDDLIIFGFNDGGLIVFDAITWEPLVNNFDKRSGITAINFIDNQYFITGHIDGVVIRLSLIHIYEPTRRYAL